MKIKSLIILFMAVALIIGAAGVGFSSHVEEKGVVKGIVTAARIVEVELTVKDEMGTETTVKTGDATFKLGDRVVIKDGKVTKEVKPITGGY